MVNYFDDAYRNLALTVLEKGTRQPNRTGTDAVSLFAPPPMHFNLRKGFPLLTTKKVHFKSVVGELLWMLSGSSNAKELRDKYGVTIWDEWAKEDGSLGPVYGYQWRHWGEDQIKRIVHQIKHTPDDRGIILSAWNVADLQDMALRPCHMMAQWKVQDGELHCQLYQRSADVFLGVPFNIASYSLLTLMLAHVTGTSPGLLTHVIGDAHVYMNHLPQLQEQLTRESFSAPYVSLSQHVQDIDSFTMDDIKLANYVSHPALKGEVAI